MSVNRSSQAHGGTQAVRPVAAHSGVQMPPSTIHAAPAPNSAWQSVSLLQSRQMSVAASAVRSPQKAALPVVSVQTQLGLLGWHETPSPTVQVSESAKQMPALWATQTLVSGWPCLGALPSQMPE